MGQAEVQNDATVRLLQKDYLLNADGSSQLHFHKEVLLHSYFSFHRLYGETFIVYNPQYQKLKINECYTIMADGRKVVAPPNAFNEVLPRFAADAAAYNHLREMVVTHTGLEIGATIVLDYTLSSAKDFQPAFMGKETFSEISPIQNMEVSVKLPEGAVLNYRMYNTSIQALRMTEGKLQVYRWKMQNLPALISESFQPVDTKFLPTLVFSTSKDLNEVYSAIIRQEAFQFRANEEMKKEVEKFRNENQDELLAVLKVRDMLVKDFHLVNVPLALMGYRVRTAAETWKSAGGTELEKAVLLTSLLSAMNIDAELMTAVAEIYDPSMGCVNWENFMVRVLLSDKKAMLLGVKSADDQSLWYQMAGRYLMPLNPKKQLAGRLEKVGESSVEAAYRLIVNENGTVEGDVKMQLEGACNPYFDLKKPENKPYTYLAGSLAYKDGKDFELQSVEAGESNIKINIKKENALQKRGDYYFLALPLLNRGIQSLRIGELPSERKSPMEFSYLPEESYTYAIDLPENWRAMLPPSVTLKNDAGTFSFETKVRGNNLQLKKSIEFERSGGDQAWYKAFRELMNHWNAQLYKEAGFSSGK